jgi:hypothetical protein
MPGCLGFESFVSKNHLPKYTYGSWKKALTSILELRNSVPSRGRLWGFPPVTGDSAAA